MARTPSMTPQEAIAAIGYSRGNLPSSILPETHKLLRKWATASGLPGQYAASMKKWKLVNCYNYPDSADYGLEWHKRNAITQGLTAPAADDDETAEPAEPAIPESVANIRAATQAAAIPQSADNDAGKLAGVLADILAKGGCNPEMVNAIIDQRLASLPDMIAKHSPSVTVKVSINGAEAKAIDGHTHKMLPQVIEAIGQNVPVMLVGPAGGGKSTAGEQCAHALGLEFYIQGAASGTHEYIGYKDGAGNYHSTPFRQAFEHGGLFCAEELDSGSADVPLILNAGLANGHMAFPDSTKPVPRHKDFRIIANANTFGNGADRIYVGRTQLDGATIDRFAFLTWDYDTALERKLAGNDSWVDRVQAIRRGVVAEKARVIVSPRASIMGAKMIAAGWSFDQAESAFIWKGADAELRRRILNHAH